MKNLSTLLAFFCLIHWAEAQITVSNATFPVAGDTLRTIVDLSPQGIEITPAGGPYNWNFESLGYSFEQETVFRPASEGSAAADFPAATLYTVSLGGQSETYYSVSSTSFNNLGFSGAGLTGNLPIQAKLKFSPPVPERRAPMNFIDNHFVEASLKIAFSVSDIPGGILDSLPVSAFVDSIRIRFAASRYDLVDAYGSLAIPGGTYDVLREKRTEYRDTRLDVHSFLGWQDITDLILGSGGGGGFFEDLGKDTTISYLFFSGTEKNLIASVNAGSDGLVPRQVSFKNNGVISSTIAVEDPEAAVTVWPNPASREAVFELKNFHSGTYFIQLFSTSGAIALNRKIILQGTSAEQVDLSSLGSGTWFYRVKNEAGTVLATGKLLKTN